MGACVDSCVGACVWEHVCERMRGTSLKIATDIRTCMEDRDVWHVIIARGDST